MNGSFRFSLLLLSAAFVLPLAGCQTTAGQADRADKVSAVLERAADQASQEGNTAESLALLERSYKRNSSDLALATKYAHALRVNDRLNRAALVLGPFVNDGGEANGEAHREYAATMAAMGSYEDAEAHARQAVLMAPEDGQAYHILGIALDAQGHHKQAETAFRKGLEYWTGDPGPILNNLGLNLATQGFLDEAVDTLRKAAAVSPDRQEIERNLRIVGALQTQPSGGGSAASAPLPRPGHKPMHTEFKGISVDESTDG